MVAALLVVHTAVSVRALRDHDFFWLFRFAVADWPQGQIFSDLTCMRLVVTSWMVVDARRSGRTVWPYLLATLLLGSFGPLTYLLVRELRPTPAPVG